MKSYILNPEIPTTQTGSSLRSLIQNSKDPILDLFVRESLQNSLDAQDNSSVPFVDARYYIGNFHSKSLNAILDNAKENLNNKYQDGYYKYIAIRDTNTTGLKGALKSSDVVNGEWGNLQKLVYQICKPQEQEGKGGCWGIGKTVYFRMSPVGLVLYYSRTKNENGLFESRFCAAMVEDQTKDDAILPPYDPRRNNKSGIAWWGNIDEANYNLSYPITDEAEIDNYLKIFNISPFDDHKTGTVVIIPYIEEQELINHNRMIIGDDGELSSSTSWPNTISEYLRIAVQRWYAPRLDNPFYHEVANDNSKYLRAYINDVEIKYDDMQPIFQTIQNLYNGCISKINAINNPTISRNPEIKVSSVNYRNQDGFLGQLGHQKISKAVLTNIDSVTYNMLIGDNQNSSNDINGESLPVLCMTRKPGMIVEYNSNEWICKPKIPKTPTDEVIIALFVLNSNKIIAGNHYLEEYFRKGGENADHMGWHDHSNMVNTGRFVENIFGTTASILGNSYTKTDTDEELTSVKSISSYYGRKFNISKSRRTGGGASSEQKSANTKDVKYTATKYEYYEKSMDIVIDVKTRKKTKKSELIFKIDSESAPVSADEWEKDMTCEWPFEIRNHSIAIKEYDSVSCFDQTTIPGFGIESLFDIDLIKTKQKGKAYGIIIRPSDKLEHNYHIELTLTISLDRVDVRPIIEM